jgi:hypothetical protein
MSPAATLDRARKRSCSASHCLVSRLIVAARPSQRARRPRRDGLQAARRRPGALAAVQRPRLVADVLAGATFKDGIKVTDDEPTTTDEEVAG